MNVLLLAAGLGTRLLPLTKFMPKCLVPIQGVPLLFWWFELLRTTDTKNIVVNTHYMPELIREFVNNSPYSEKVQLVHEPVLLGTGGTLLKNQSALQGEAVMVVHADNLSSFDANAFWQAHRDRPKNCLMTMMSFECKDPKSCGILELDEHHVVQAFHEKSANPPGRLANGAVYIFENDIFARLGLLNQITIDLSTEILPHMMGRIFTYANTTYHRDIGQLSSLQKAQEEFKFPFSPSFVPDSKWWQERLGAHTIRHLGAELGFPLFENSPNLEKP